MTDTGRARAAAELDGAQDLVHTPSADPRWRESYYFSFYDPATQIGGFTSIGKRPSKGHSGFILCLWGEDRPTLVATAIDKFADHDNHHEVAGLEYECLEPFGEWAIRFRGDLNDGGTEVECRPAAVAPIGAADLPRRSVELDLVFSRDHQPYYYASAAKDDRWRELFDGHIDMVGRVTGSIKVDGETLTVDAAAGNDHSWGIRNWFYPEEWRWMDILTDDGPHLTMWRSRVNGEWFGDGGLYREGGVTALASYSERIDVESRAEKPRPSTIALTAEADGNRLDLRGEVVRAVPVLFTRNESGRRLVSWNDRCLVRFNSGSGWGNVEFERRLEGD